MSNLNSLCQKYRVQPVGKGDIDMIVMRENYFDFAQALLENGYQITAISWWEHVAGKTFKPRFGMGGVKSRFYSGWFSERCVIDNLPDMADLVTIKHGIENKAFDDTVTFQNTSCLVPAFWVNDEH